MSSSSLSSSLSSSSLTSLSSYCIIHPSRRIFVPRHYLLSSQNLIASISYFISSIASLKFIPIAWFNHHLSVIPSAPSVSSQTESINLYCAYLFSLKVGGIIIGVRFFFYDLAHNLFFLHKLRYIFKFIRDIFINILNIQSLALLRYWNRVF